MHIQVPLLIARKRGFAPDFNLRREQLLAHVKDVVIRENLKLEDLQNVCRQHHLPVDETMPRSSLMQLLAVSWLGCQERRVSKTHRLGNTWYSECFQNERSQLFTPEVNHGTYKCRDYSSPMPEVKRLCFDPQSSRVGLQQPDCSASFQTDLP